MKKFYAEPDFEIVNIRLVADVLVDSKETDYTDIPGGDMDGGFGDGDF